MPRMGGSSRDSFTNVDTAVGTIVWVRRRNGSWWPGRIISDAELSTANLLSPRSGTPVKLLGREDGSVDWYNIQKSKRVKPFRCGEFDDCIEKAKAAAGLPTKKREKYARREDAILDALELEKQQLECSSEFITASTFRRNDEVSTGDRARSRRKRKGKAKPPSSPEETESENSDVYPEEDSAGLSSSGKGQEELDWNADEEDGVEEEEEEEEEEEDFVELPRMRGLQDLGLRGMAGRGNHGNAETQQKSISCLTGINGSTVPYFTTRRKRTLTAQADERKRARMRPSNQFLESMVDEENALVEGSQTLGGMEGMGVEFTSSAAKETLVVATTTGIADRTCCSLSGHATAECCVPLEANQAGLHKESPVLLLKNTDEDNRLEWSNASDGKATKYSPTLPEEDDREQVLGLCWSQEQWVNVPVAQGKVTKETVPLVQLVASRRRVIGYPVVVEAIDSNDLSDPDWGTSSARAGANVRKKQGSKKNNVTKKLLKKVAQSSRKTRTLSSFASAEKLDNGVGNNNPWGDYDWGKTGYAWPVPTCVPVKTALNRIKAAVCGDCGS